MVNLTMSSSSRREGMFQLLTMVALLQRGDVLSFTPVQSNSGRNSQRGFHPVMRGGSKTSATSTKSSTELFYLSVDDLRADAVAMVDEESDPTSEVDKLEEIGIRIPYGLRQTLLKNAREKITRRIWIVDNSGSMTLHDGHITDNYDNCCTRWCEVQETVTCHSLLSATIEAPTEFRLLNPPKPYTIGCKSTGLKLSCPVVRGPQRFQVGYGKKAAKDCQRAQSIMLRNEPNGRTPLPESIHEVRRDVERMMPQLNENEKICIVIATDGGSYNLNNVGLEMDEAERNADMIEALESLKGLPVNVVIRLCTDYQPLVDFYNDLDCNERLDSLDIDVLDDHVAEAAEVYAHNPWLNYALVLHRMREMGQDCRLFDLLDERPLTEPEIREFCYLLFGHPDLQDHDSDWDAFLQTVDDCQRQEDNQWNPYTRKVAPWVDVSQLASMVMPVTEDYCSV